MESSDTYIILEITQGGKKYIDAKYFVMALNGIQTRNEIYSSLMTIWS